MTARVIPLPKCQQLVADNRKLRVTVGHQNLVITALVARLAEVSPNDPLLGALDFLKLDSPFTPHATGPDA